MPEFPFTTDTGSDTREVDPFGIALPNGTILSGWTQFRTGVSGRFTTLRIINADGSAVTGELDIAPGSYDALDPTVVVLSDNKFLLVEAGFFSSGGEFGFNIYGHVITSSGGTLTAGPLIDLSTPTGSTSNGNIEAVLLDNGYVAIVTDQTNDRVDNNNPFVVLAVVDQDLNVVTDYTQVGERMQNSPSSINVDGNGDTVAIAWTQNAGSFSVPVLGQTVSVNSDGSLAPFVLDDHVLLGSDAAAFDGSYGLRDMKVLANGDILAIFSGQYTSAGDETLSDRLYGQIFSSDFTATVTSAFRIDSVQSDYGVSAAEIVAFEGGGFLVAFSSIPNTTAAGSDFEVYYRVYDNTYTATGGIVRVTDNDDGLAYGSGAGQSNAGSQDILGSALLSGAGGDVTLLYERTVISESFDYGDENVFGISLSNLDPNPATANTAPVITSNGGGATAAINVSENSAAVTTVIANDAESTPTFAISGGTDQGKFSIDSTTGVLTFNFAPDFESPTDSDGNNTYVVVVRASDGSLSDDQTLTVTVTNVNDAPVANDDVVALDEDTTADFGVLANDTDVDGDTLTVTAVTQGAHGTVSINPDYTIHYVPVADYSGPDSFTYTMSDGAIEKTATVSVTVRAVNDPPYAFDDTATVEEDGSVAIFVTANDTDADNQPLNIVQISTPGHGSVQLNGDNSITYTPNANFSGLDTFTYTVNDDQGRGAFGESTATVSVTVTGVNDAPDNIVPAAQSTDEDTSLVFSGANGNAIAVSDVDVGGGTMTVTLAASHGVLTLSGTSGLTFTSGDGTADATMVFDGTAADINAALEGLTFAPDADYNGMADVTITTNDHGNTGAGGALQDADTVAITVMPVSDRPEGTDNTVTLAEDSSYTFTSADFGFSDIDGDTFVELRISSLPTNGSLTFDGSAVTVNQTPTVAQIDAGLLVFTPDPDANGTGYASFTFQVRDDGEAPNRLDETPNTLTFDVTAVNDAPVNSVPAAQLVAEDSTLTFSSGTANLISVSDIDANGGSLTVTLAATDGALTLASTAGLTFADADGSDGTLIFDGTVADINAALDGLVYAPNSNFNGAATLTITTNDQGNSGSGGALQDADSIDITVSSVNDAPVNHLPAAQAVAEDGSLTLSAGGGNAISVSDVDAGGGSLTVTLAATHGVLTLSGTGGLTFSTGDGTSDGTMTFAGTLANINAALNGLVYVPDADYYGAAGITVTTNDQGNNGSGGPLQDSDILAIDVTAVNDAPVNTVPGAQATDEDTALVFSAGNGNQVSVSDIDVGAGSLVVTVAATNGVLTLSQTTGLTITTGDGTADPTIVMTGTQADINAALNGLVFTPDANYHGPADVTITTNDQGNTGGGALQDSDTIDITVASVNDAPQLDNLIADFASPEDTALSYTFPANTFSDVDGDALTYTATRANGNPLPAWLSFDGTTRTFSGTPPLDYNGSINVRVTASDGSLSADDVFTLTITPVEDPAVARDDVFITNESTVVIGNVYANNGKGPDTDPDGPIDAVVKVAGLAGNVGTTFALTSGATVKLQANGDLLYSPAASFTQLAAAGSGASNTQINDSFTYTLSGGSQAIVTVIVNGLDTADTLLGTAGNDSLHAGAYDDVLIGYTGADVLDGGTGNDTASYAPDIGGVFVNLTLGQGSGNAAQGDTYISIENVIGTGYNDVIIGDNGVNRLDGGGGNDRLIGSLGGDILIGGAGSDWASYEDNQGSVFVNLMSGMGYNNAAEGDTYSGIENAIGGMFDDFLLGDDNANRLDGAMGADTLYGFGGADTFIFSYAPGAMGIFVHPNIHANVDTLMDFVSGEDKLEINASAFGGGLTPGALAAGAFTVGTAATDADDRFIYDQANGNLYFDADGNGGGAQVLMAILPNHAPIAASDFVVV